MRFHAWVVVCSLLLMSACSDYPDANGQLALTTRGSHAVVLIHTCYGAVDELEISADREGLPPDQQNPTLGRLRARHPISGSTTVDLVDPGPQWEVVTPVSLPTDPTAGFIVTARQESAGTEMKQVSAKTHQLAILRPGEVLIWNLTADDASPQKSTTTQFSTQACHR